MGYTRRQFINAAFEEIGLADYVFDLPPEGMQGAARRLDSMLLDWNARGIRLGPNISGSIAVADLDTNMGIPDSGNEAIITNLAIKIAPSYGKQVSGNTLTAARFGLNTLLGRAAMPPEQRYSQGLPAGQGNKPWVYGDEGLPQGEYPLDVGPDSILELY
jgi:hypothetical protein